MAKWKPDIDPRGPSCRTICLVFADTSSKREFKHFFVSKIPMAVLSISLNSNFRFLKTSWESFTCCYLLLGTKPSCLRCFWLCGLHYSSTTSTADWPLFTTCLHSMRGHLDFSRIEMEQVDSAVVRYFHYRPFPSLAD